MESEAVRKDAEARVGAMKSELSETTEEIARLEAQDAARADELAALREANRALELKVGRLEARAEHATRMEGELMEARAALAKAEQQVIDLQGQLAKAGDVQRQLAMWAAGALSSAAAQPAWWAREAADSEAAAIAAVAIMKAQQG